MNKNLRKVDYDKIEETVNDLIEDLGLREFPVNCFEAAVRLGVETRKYSELSKPDRDFIASKMEYGFSIKRDGKYVIYYNHALDRYKTRFAIWHEIAHIQLGLLEASCRESCARIKEEANHFAAYVMVPPVFIHKLGLDDPRTISDVCKVSFDYACSVLSHYNRSFRFAGLRSTALDGRIEKLLDRAPDGIVA